MTLIAMVAVASADAGQGALPPPGSVERDVVYASPGGESLMMDVRFPRTRAGRPWPCVIAVHGGGWSEGDKEGFHFDLARRGFVVASINYRMYPAHRFPAMIEDVKSAIRFVRANADRFNVDPERIGLIGHSAGGHLVALAGLAGTEAGWDVGENLDQSSTVRAVVALSAPTDLRRPLPEAWADGLRYTVFAPGQWTHASPVSWVRRDAPPFLIIHGEKDQAVPPDHAEQLAGALQDGGAAATLVIVGNAGHGFERVGGAVWPPVPLLVGKAVRFLRRALR